MASRKVSELAEWDSRLEQQNQTSKWRSPSHHARNSRTSLSFGTPQPSIVFSNKKRAENTSFRSNLVHRNSGATKPPTNTRLATRIDTTTSSLHPMRDRHHSSISASLTPFPARNVLLTSTQHAPPRPSLPSSPLSISSQSSPVIPVHSRFNSSRLSSSLGRVMSLQTASTTKSDVIDLTIEDTEEELSVSDHLPTDPSSSRQPFPSPRDSPLPLEQSLFTPPPPPKKHVRLFVDYLSVPPFPNGLTKADYQPLSHSPEMPPAGTSATSMLKPASSVESPATPVRTHLVQGPKDKERELDATTSLQNYQGCVPADGEDLALKSSDDGLTEIPLYDDDDYPPLTTRDLTVNSRFQFAHAWRAQASKLQEAGPGWAFSLKTLEKASDWACSVNVLSPRVPGTTGYVSIEQLRPWELAPPGKVADQVSNEQAHVTVDVKSSPNNMQLLGDAPVIALSGPQLLSSMAVETDNDMNQYFDGLSDLLNKNTPSRQQLVPTYLRSHLLHSTRRGEVSFESGAPSLELDRFAGTSGHECFLGVPPSPTTTEMDPPIALGPTAGASFGSTGYVTTSPSNTFVVDATPIDAWTFEQGECLPLNDKSLPSNDVPSISPGTINPSLLGPEQPPTPSARPKPTRRQRSKLPEPVIYIRRPIDASTLSLISGKRPVRIKYRDPDVPPTPPSRKLSDEASSSHPENPTEPSASDADEPFLGKRRQVPSRRLREAFDSYESESDFVPETSKPKIRVKVKQRTLKDSQYKDTETEPPIMSFCHQCRNTSKRPKMSCSNMVGDRVCGKRFCNRCILYRYPDITFDEHSASFLCPACTNTCNCSHCSRSRGEEFISMRLKGLATSIFKSKVTLVRDADGSFPHGGSPDTATQRDGSLAKKGKATQPRFWAHVYDMEGAHVGSAFMPRELVGRLNTPSASASVSPPLVAVQKGRSYSQPRGKVRKPRRREKKPNKPSGPRIFIGQPLASWKVRAVRDLEPSADVNEDRDETIVGKGKGKARGRRWYIGNSAALHEPHGRMSRSVSPVSVTSRCSTPGVCSDGNLSECVVDNWPQPEVGECCEWAPRAIDTGMSVGGSHSASDAGGLFGVLAEQGPAAGSPEATGTVMQADERASTSTSLSEQDVAKAISAALAALRVEPPC